MCVCVRLYGVHVCVYKVCVNMCVCVCARTVGVCVRGCVYIGVCGMRGLHACVLVWCLCMWYT